MQFATRLPASTHSTPCPPPLNYATHLLYRCSKLPIKPHNSSPPMSSFWTLFPFHITYSPLSFFCSSITSLEWPWLFASSTPSLLAWEMALRGLPCSPLETTPKPFHHSMEGHRIAYPLSIPSFSRAKDRPGALAAWVLKRALSYIQKKLPLVRRQRLGSEWILLSALKFKFCLGPFSLAREVA